jgi:SNF2-related protein
LLSEGGYEGKLMLFNGTNTDPFSKKIYEDWKTKNPTRVTPSKTADMRTALVEHFRDTTQIMIATEAAAEGINLQFCSLVVNYDLPWNPQRIEQRIGRCHRYGQKHDVVVVNFLNMNNEADVRVYELLNSKLKLFDGVFGSSDEILGAIGDGIDFERRIAEIYQTCRTSQEIQTEFDFIQQQFSAEIGENMRQARQKLLENFDAEVAERLNIFHEASAATIDKMQAILWGLTQYELRDTGTFFDEENLTFQMLNPDSRDYTDKKLYAIKWTGDYCEPYGITHPIAQKLINRAAARDLPYRGILFDYENTVGKISALEQLPKKSGKLMLSKVSIGENDPEEHLVLTCIDDLGNVIPQDTARRLFNLNARVYDTAASFDKCRDKLNAAFEIQENELLDLNIQNTTKQFEEEVEKLEHWSDDRKAALELKIKELDKQLREIKKTTRTLRTLEEKLANQRKLGAVESERMTMRRKLYEAQDAIDAERDRLIKSAEKSLTNKINSQIIFAIEWRIV